MAPQCHLVIKRLAEKLSQKQNLQLSVVGWLRCRLSFALLRTTLLCVRATRRKKIVYDNNIELAVSAARMDSWLKSVALCARLKSLALCVRLVSLILVSLFINQICPWCPPLKLSALVHMRLASVFEPCFRHYYLASIISHHLKNNYEVKFKKKKFNIYSFYCCTDALCGNFSKKVSIVAPSSLLLTSVSSLLKCLRMGSARPVLEAQIRSLTM